MAQANALDAAARDLRAIHRARPAADAPPPADTASLAATSLVALTTGPDATPEPTVRLAGVAHSRGRTAALLEINDKPAQWLTRGEGRDGVTLQAILPSAVVVDTVYGQRQVALGEHSAGAPAAPASPAPPAPAAPIASTPDAPPPGFRLPPPPASAPRSK